MVLPHEMAAWTPSRGQTDREAGMSEIRNRLEYFQRKVKARRGPKATMEIRVALIVAERGLTEKQLAKYYVQRRKDWIPRFDHWRFAKDQAFPRIGFSTAISDRIPAEPHRPDRSSR
jgi:hypothetical protein